MRKKLIEEETYDELATNEPDDTVIVTVYTDANPRWLENRIYKMRGIPNWEDYELVSGGCAIYFSLAEIEDYYMTEFLGDDNYADDELIHTILIDLLKGEVNISGFKVEFPNGEVIQIPITIGYDALYNTIEKELQVVIAKINDKTGLNLDCRDGLGDYIYSMLYEL